MTAVFIARQCSQPNWLVWFLTAHWRRSLVPPITLMGNICCCDREFIFRHWAKICREASSISGRSLKFSPDLRGNRRGKKLGRRVGCFQTFWRRRQLGSRQFSSVEAPHLLTRDILWRRLAYQLFHCYQLGALNILAGILDTRGEDWCRRRKYAKQNLGVRESCVLSTCVAEQIFEKYRDLGIPHHSVHFIVRYCSVSSISCVDWNEQRENHVMSYKFKCPMHWEPFIGHASDY